jgi:hypothetical protein
MNTANLWRMTAALTLALGAAIIGPAGCTSSTQSSQRGDVPDTVANRPLVGRTAVEAAMADGDAPLSFFDDLEMRPLASQDDAIHACLLLGTGASAPTYEERLAMAAKLGYVPKTYARPARQAVTMGEVSTMAINLLEDRNLDQAAALNKLVQRGIAPPSAKANQGLTGAQLVSIAGGLRDAMRIEGVKRVAAPHIEISDPKTAQTPAVAEGGMRPSAMGGTEGVALGEAANGIKPSISAAQGEAQPAMAADSQVALTPSQGRAEALPNIPVGTAPPAIDLADPKGKPSVIGPDDQVITPGQPRTKAASASQANSAPTPPTPGAQPASPTQPQTASAEGANAGKVAPPVHKKPKWVLGKPLHQKTADAEETK